MSQTFQPVATLRTLAIQSGLNTETLTDEYLLSEAFAKHLDSCDELASFRSEFHIPCRDLQSDPVATPHAEQSSYLCGNSLGLQPKRTEKYLMEELLKWRTVGVEGHFTGSRPWAKIDEFSTPFSAQIVGAASPDDVVIMNSLSLNLHLLLTSFYRPTAGRSKIFIESGAFCSDYHVVKSQLSLHGYNPDDHLITIAPRDGETFLRTEDIVAKIDQEGDSIAVVLFPGVQFSTGQAFDMKTITEAAHAKGCIAGFDLAHAVGNIPLELHNWGVDFAAWCSYKYLNAGPGSIAGAFVHPRHQHKSLTELPRLTGWWGQTLENRFSMGSSWQGKPGAQSWQLSNPAVTAVVCLQAAIEVMCEASLPKLREKSIRLTNYLEAMTAILCGVKSWEDGLSCEDNISIRQLTPRDFSKRGCQISLLFPINVSPVNDRLLKSGIICDVRKPSILRVSPTPLYNSFSDVYLFSQQLKTIWDETSQAL